MVPPTKWYGITARDLTSTSQKYVALTMAFDDEPHDFGVVVNRHAIPQYTVCFNDGHLS